MANIRASGPAKASASRSAHTRTRSQRSDDEAVTASRPSRSSRPATAISGSARAAAGEVERKEHLVVHLPVLGEVRLPHPQDLAYYGGVGVLMAAGLLEWPAALALSVGHALVSQHRSRALQELGDALDDV